MRKIICELCGTVYPDTEANCPTCGSEKPASVEYIPESPAESAPRREYTPTKGGRFSDSNVKKRLQGKGVAPAPAPRKKPSQPQREQAPRQQQPKSQQPRKEESGSNKGLVITAIILVIAIIAMLIYIYVTFLMPKPTPNQPEQTKGTNPPIPQQTTTEAPDLSCKKLILSESSIRLDKVGASWLLNVIPEPANTTDAITFVSADPAIAEVTADGKITAVSGGETVITVTCGEIVATCQIICDIVPETTVPETTVPETTEAVIELKLNRDDITFSKQGEAWPLYNGEIPLNEITWSVGNESVATIRNGTVRAVGPGTTTVYAEYKGQKVSCIIRCSF